MKTAAIYARKSKISEKGDSIENQIKLCSKYLDNLDITNFKIYKDEGFSGKNTERPEFQKMLVDAKLKKFDIIICYKLDRISRNVSDFSTLISDLDNLQISFISVVEQFDTSSAIGKAMMYICSVFSQLERETISQRITDNMYSLASDGYWLGGETPTGFTNKRQSFTSNGKQRSYSVLIHVPSEIALVKLIYSKYLEFRSLSKLEKYMLSNNIKTKRNKDWSKNSLSGILKNSTYAKADEKLFEYLKSTGANTFGTPDGIHGLLIYKKHKGKSGKKHDISEWIYAISEHEGIIDSQTWITVQKLLENNRELAPASGCSHTAILSGLVRCAKCNSSMRVAYGTKIPNSNKKRFYYMCTLKHNSGKTRCNNKNVPGIDLDSLILNKLKEMSLDKNTLVKELLNYKNSIEESSQSIVFKNIKNTISKNTDMINNLLNTIALTTDSDVVNMLLEKISDFKNENIDLNKKLDDIKEELTLQQNLINDCDVLIDKLKHFSKFIDDTSIEEQKKLVSSIIERIMVNGDTGEIEIKFKALLNFKI